MKRSSLTRSTPLSRGAPLGRKKRIRAVSKKIDADEREAKKLCRYLVVELRDQNTCQRCPNHTGIAKIDWAHVKNRGAKSLVVAPYASLALCAGCHFWFDGRKGSMARPGEGMLWWMQKFPERATQLAYWEHHRSRPKINYRVAVAWLKQEIQRYGG